MDINKNSIVHEYFYKNTWQTYYIAGFICADGSICRSGKNKQQLSISVHKKDKQILSFIKSEVNCNARVCKKGEDYVRLGISSPDLILGLKDRFKIDRNKTGNEVFPDSDTENSLVWSFCYGYFDGDGCFYNSDIEITCASEDFLIKMSDFFGAGKVSKFNHSDCYRLRVFSNKDVANIAYNFISNTKFGLSRKRVAMERFLKRVGRISPANSLP